MRSSRPFLQEACVPLAVGRICIRRASCGSSVMSNQSAAREAGHHPAHRRRLDLLGGRQFAQRLRTSENQHGKRGQARRTFSGGNVLLAQPAQQMDGGGVQPVGNDKPRRPGILTLGMDSIRIVLDVCCLTLVREYS